MLFYPTWGLFTGLELLHDYSSHYYLKDSRSWLYWTYWFRCFPEFFPSALCSSMAQWIFSVLTEMRIMTRDKEQVPRPSRTIVFHPCARNPPWSKEKRTNQSGLNVCEDICHNDYRFSWFAALTWQYPSPNVFHSDFENGVTMCWRNKKQCEHLLMVSRTDSCRENSINRIFPDVLFQWLRKMYLSWLDVFLWPIHMLYRLPIGSVIG